jgi:peptidoglycan/LPS O-acetylase OafA/YrhL
VIPEGTTFWGVIFKQVLLGMTAFGIGVMLYRAAFVERRRRRPFLVAGFLGMAAVLLPIATAIVRAPLIDPDWRALMFVAGLVLASVGFVGDAIKLGRERKESGEA